MSAPSDLRDDDVERLAIVLEACRPEELAALGLAPLAEEGSGDAEAAPDEGPATLEVDFTGPRMVLRLRGGWQLGSGRGQP